MHNTTVKNTVEVEAVVRPKCLCGLPWSEHGPCGGYRPDGPIRDYGTVAFQSVDLIANFLWFLESKIKNLRRRRMRGR